MCRVLRVARSGFYHWLHHPLSDRARANQRLVQLIRASYVASGGVYGSPRIFLDLREVGETCGKHRVARLMRANQIRAVRGYQRPRGGGGRPSLIAPNILQREFTVAHPNQVWVTDITYLRTWQGWMYLAVVMDLYARNIHRPGALRSRRAVRQPRLAALLPGEPSGAEHESAWELLGQRRRGIVL